MAVRRIAPLIAFIIQGGIAHAAGVVLESGPQQTVMIELFTSEACSSCPAADQFLNRLVNNKQLWKSYIPLAFHVDYWDDLGWQDRFASPSYSLRQQQYARFHAASTIYTPEFFVNGREWRRGMRNMPPVPVTRPVGTLRIVLNNRQLDAQFFPIEKPTSRFVLHIARLGMQLSSHVRSGENAGRRLHHEFVVLQYTRLNGDHLAWSAKLPALAVPATRQALVAWVSRRGDPRPLQAVGGYVSPYTDSH